MERGRFATVNSSLSLQSLKEHLRSYSRITAFACDHRATKSLAWLATTAEEQYRFGLVYILLAGAFDIELPTLQLLVFLFATSHYILLQSHQLFYCHGR